MSKYNPENRMLKIVKSVTEPKFCDEYLSSLINFRIVSLLKTKIWISVRIVIVVIVIPSKSKVNSQSY